MVGGLLGFAIGCILSNIIFGTARPAAQPVRRRSQAGNPGAAFLLLTVVMFGGMAAGVAVAG